MVTHDIVKRHAGLPTLADRADSLIVVSPFAATAEADKSNTIIDITPHAHTKLVELRDAETEGAQLGLRLEILSQPGEDFRYDLSFDFFTKAAFSDEVRTINGLKIIIPLNSFEHINGAVLDYSERQGLIIRNPNKPPAIAIETRQPQHYSLSLRCQIASAICNTHA